MGYKYFGGGGGGGGGGAIVPFILFSVEDCKRFVGEKLYIHALFCYHTLRYLRFLIVLMLRDEMVTSSYSVDVFIRAQGKPGSSSIDTVQSMVCQYQEILRLLYLPR